MKTSLTPYLYLYKHTLTPFLYLYKQSTTETTFPLYIQLFVSVFLVRFSISVRSGKYSHRRLGVSAEYAHFFRLISGNKKWQHLLRNRKREVTKVRLMKTLSWMLYLIVRAYMKIKTLPLSTRTLLGCHLFIYKKKE